MPSWKPRKPAIASTGELRTLLWHLRRTGLDSVEGLLPFAEPLTTERGFDVQAARYEDAMGAGV